LTKLGKAVFEIPLQTNPPSHSRQGDVGTITSLV